MVQEGCLYERINNHIYNLKEALNLSFFFENELLQIVGSKFIQKVLNLNLKI